ncbi:MAG TPA: hypothetical protein PLN05_09890 [Pyrinomonadaceae bacterium]|nr:hypothetical protein [Chloracidobacterium sp.]HBE81431.1 hypothetical protein [Blastocatellia bacterium]HRJ90258.1 hypothetical protein [Pyrinomonadaceae bacterium]HRK50727.1 hypothetical protein [Pyrinomonadaceae bacterium]
MKVNINANICDLATERIAARLQDVFDIIEKDVSRDYGGTMQHLWIDFELSQFGIDRRPPFPFRFQKKVGGGISRLTGLRTEVYENVGHYSVRPDFDVLLDLPLGSVPSYALGLIYMSTSVLVDKKKKLGGFDAERFRIELLSSCTKHGYEIQN